ncbi:hypothetical protein SM0020_29180 [Sinorhizobium meliloti CCNWSX0020]|uniref:Uncharacterized protein n=1 Tax=Sinorhizobium meliloti CCNWSX0020 TaxID=1107881 RepID=H0G8J5_RHIML|nr:hypothetical protein SM0020_29180 [Sinorhizobium meliloti CCNWSX0020]
MGRNPECPCRQRAKDFAFGYQSVEPGHASLPSQHHHLPVVERRKIGIRLDRQDGIGLRPVVDRRPPNPREIELVTIGERETEGSVAKLRGRHQAAVGWKRPSFRTDDVYGAGSAVARPQPPRQLHHLHIAVMAPYDDAALVERGVELENLRAHHR